MTTRSISLTVAGASMTFACAAIAYVTVNGAGSMVHLANGSSYAAAESPSAVATAANVSATYLAPVTESNGTDIMQVGVGQVNRIYDNGGGGSNLVFGSTSTNIASTDSLATVTASLNT